MTIAEDKSFKEAVLDADAVLSAEHRLNEVMPAFVENFLDPDAQQALADFLASDELREANRAAPRLRVARLEEI